jgi:hypothetical protein
MTVKELINELLEYPMDSDVTLRIKLSDIDLDYEEFEVELERHGGGWGKEQPYLSVNLEDKKLDQLIIMENE